VYIRIRSYIKSVLRYKFLIVDTIHPDTIYDSKNVSVPNYFPKSNGVRKQRRLGNTVTIFRLHIIFLSTSALQTAIILAFYERRPIGLVLVNHYQCIFVHQILRVILLKARRDTLCLTSLTETSDYFTSHKHFSAPPGTVHFISRTK